MDTFFLTFKDPDRREWYVRIQAPTREHALAYTMQKYGIDWDELLPDVVFNPATCRLGEFDAVQVLP